MKACRTIAIYVFQYGVSGAVIVWEDLDNGALCVRLVKQDPCVSLQVASCGTWGVSQP